MIKEISFVNSAVINSKLSVDDSLKKFSSKLINLAVSKVQSHKQGNNHSKDRSEVAGSSKKLFKQKGTGNARAGNAKSPIRRGGGKAFGPKFHLVNFKINKKTKSLSKTSCLVKKIENNSLYIFNEEEINVDNFIKTINSTNHKSFSIVLKNTKGSEILKKFNNYKHISFMSDTTFSVFKSLKNEALIISKNSVLFSQNLSGIIK